MIHASQICHLDAALLGLLVQAEHSQKYCCYTIFSDEWIDHPINQ